MSGSDSPEFQPVKTPVPLVVLPGDSMNSFIRSIEQLLPAEPVIIGGLAVMSRVGGEHRPTLDIDSVFNNEC